VGDAAATSVHSALLQIADDGMIMSDACPRLCAADHAGMARSSIDWTDETWNPVTGCIKISPGCKHCYAERFAERFRGVKDHPYENGFDPTLRSDRIEQPLSWRRPRMCSSTA
jgi:hypothetical protein